VIQLDTQDRSKKFNQEDLELVQIVADQASIALENARLNKEAEAQERLRCDLELGRQVQQSFLPKPPWPVVPGYELAAYDEARYQVSGDFFDFIPLPDGRLAVCIADVAGMGIAAALIASQLSVAARFVLCQEADPARAVGKLNDLACKTCSPLDRFITFVLAVIDPHTHEITLVNAGHLSPFLYRPGDSYMVEVTPRKAIGVPLGIMEPFAFEACKITLAPGESLILLTDGVIDACDTRNTCFGVEGLEQALVAAAKADSHLSAEGLLDGIVRAVKQHSIDRGLGDELTLVAVRRNMEKEKDTRTGHTG
jgi:serine phosphatase RsbU (regulator of sigma subunit)